MEAFSKISWNGKLSFESDEAAIKEYEMKKRQG
jgi:hypothetical protein